MEGRSPHDEVHALVSGTLSPEEEQRLRERCETDPRLRALLAEYREVHALTAAGDEEPPPCRTTFEDVTGALVPQRAWRMDLRRTWRAVAAVLVLAVGGAFLIRAISDRSHRSAGGEAGRPLQLAAIRLRAEAAPEKEPEVPDVLADYRPVENGEIRWITSYEEGLAMAQATSRPVLLFLHHPTCPACIRLDEETFSDDRVTARVPRFVPVLLDVRTAPREIQELTRQGWPWIGTLDAEGRVIASFPGYRDAPKMIGPLSDAAALAGPPVLSWERANELAGLLVRGAAAEGAGDPAGAWGAFSRVREEVGGMPLGRAAAAGCRRVAALARADLLEAAGTFESGGRSAGLAALDRSVARFAGTPFEADLRRVRDRAERLGKFPDLE